MLFQDRRSNMQASNQQQQQQQSAVKKQTVADTEFVYSDIRLAGREGGSSQCYHIPLYGGIEEFNGYISDTEDLSNLKFIRIEDALAEGLAYEQTGMVKSASKRLNH
jgi:hypothetical protein